MKRSLVLFIALIMIFSAAISVSAADEITVIINGSVTEFDVAPRIISGRTMVPMRAVFNALDASVEWVAEARLVIATHKTSIISMRIDEYTFMVTNVITNETKTIELDVPAQIVNGRTLIPLRAVSAALGKSVEWDGANRTAIITG